MFCPKCGANIPEDDAFCTACGAKLSPDREKKPAIDLDTVKEFVKKDIFRLVIVGLAILSVIFLFSKGIGIHFANSDTGINMIVEWDTFFKNCCDVSKALPYTLQTVSVVLIICAAVSQFVPYFVPQLGKIKIYGYIPAMAAAVNLLLYAVMLIIGLASFESAAFAMVFGKCAAHPATASWFYIATLIAIIVLNLKKNLCKKEQ